jgi:hypothetical protein
MESISCPFSNVLALCACSLLMLSPFQYTLAFGCIKAQSSQPNGHTMKKWSVSSIHRVRIEVDRPIGIRFGDVFSFCMLREGNDLNESGEAENGGVCNVSLDRARMEGSLEMHKGVFVVCMKLLSRTSS